MKLKSFNYLYCLLIVLLYFSPLKSEEKKIDIWSNKEKNQSSTNNTKTKKNISQKLNIESIKTIELNQKIKVEDGSINENFKPIKVFGIYVKSFLDFVE